MTTENTPVQDEVKNPASLLAKNKELLSKLRQAQDDLATAQNALQAEKDKHGDTTAKLRKFRAEDPFKAVLAEISPNPGLMEKVLLDHLSVDVDADGKAILLNKAGEPLTWKRVGKDTAQTTVTVELNKESISDWIDHGIGDVPDSPAALFFKPKGTGAPGSRGGVYSTPVPKPKSEPVKTTSSFGLR